MAKFSLTKEQMKLIVAESQTTFFKTRFQFLREVNGLRPRLLTGLLAGTHSGKSTLLKSIIIDTIETHRCLVWLSEEFIEDYQIGLFFDNKDYNMDNLCFIEEKRPEEEMKAANSAEKLIAYIEKQIIQTNSKALFIDNITTSKAYERFGVNGQGDFIFALSEMAYRLAIPVVYVCHTNKKVTEGISRFIDGEDVRGSAQSFMQATIFFVLQRFTCGKKINSFINIKKYRFSRPKDTFFLLEYRDKCFRRDAPISFEKLDEFFCARNYLGRSLKRNNKPKPQMEF